MCGEFIIGTLGSMSLQAFNFLVITFTVINVNSPTMIIERTGFQDPFSFPEKHGAQCTQKLHRVFEMPVATKCLFFNFNHFTTVRVGGGL